MKTRHSASRIVPAVIGAFLFLLASGSRAEGHPDVHMCSNSTLKGSFGFYRTGTVDQGAGGLAAVGILSFDGKGNATVLQNISRNGDYSFDVGFTSTYVVNADCTGTGYSDEGEEFTRFVVTDDGHQVYLFSESEGNAVHGVCTKIRD